MVLGMHQIDECECGAALRSGWRAARGCHRRGFTLLEVILILMILGVVAAVGVPEIASVAVEYRLDAAARELAATIRSVQDLAVTNAREHAVMFSTATNSYVVISVNAVTPFYLSGDVVAHPLTRQPWTYSIGRHGARLVRATNSQNRSWIRFDATGAAQSGLTVVLACGSRQRTLRAEIGTGLISVE